MSTKTSISFLKDRRSFINRRAAAGALALLLVLGLLPILTSSVLAQMSPSKDRIITYQAQILKKGEPVPDGRYTITASLYNDADGMNLVWRSTYMVDLKGGIANLMLGEVRNGGVPLPEVGLDGPLYLGISVGSSTGNLTGLGEEMRPLTRLSSSPNALSVADSSITASKIAADYISGVMLDGERITKRGGELKLEAGSGIKLTYDKYSDALRVEIPPAPTANGGGVNTTNACTSNDDGAQGSNQVSGGCDNTIFHNTQYAPFEFCTISGGEHNTITNRVDLENNGSDEGTSWHTIGGGHNNRIIAEYWSSNVDQQMMGASTIGGGDSNLSVSPWGTIGGGRKNLIAKALPTVDDEQGIYLLYNTISGGDSNRILRYSIGSAIGGGSSNVIDGSDVNDPASYATISGGDTNKVYERGGTIGGGRRNRVSSKYGVVSGGVDSKIDTNSSYSTIGGGNANRVGNIAEYAAIGGGYSNRIDTSLYASIGGGRKNSIMRESDYGVIAGGDSNKVQVTSPYSTISGGLLNLIDLVAPYSTIGGGHFNSVQGPLSVISGGDSNNIGTGSDYGFIGGGRLNQIEPGSDHSTISGGNVNTIAGASSDMSFIGGGTENTISQTVGTIGGGRLNLIQATPIRGVSHSFIGGGDTNQIIAASVGAIAGGSNNSILANADYAFIGGGEENLVDENAHHSLVVGGRKNSILSNVQYSAIVGGDSNQIASLSELEPANHTLYAFLGGGQGNFIDVGGKWNVITGGDNNFNGGWHASIVGGHKNEIGRLNSYYGFLGGGDSNIIGTRTGWGTLSGGRTNYIGRPGNGYPTPAEDLIYGTIAGGDTNRVFSNYGSIGGGSQNEIRNNGSTENGGAFAAIPGGRGLVAKSYSQLVAGRFNLPLGTSTESTILPNDPLVIVGNGANSTATSNAFEISNNGHSIVFHANGTGGTGGTPAIVGGTFVDNVILAWGVVAAGAPPVVTADFGVKSVTNTVSTGVFKVDLNVTDAHNPLVQHMIDQASITVTVIDDQEPEEGVSGACGYATASRIRTTLPLPGNPPAPNPFFFVRTYSGQQTGTVSDGVVHLDCAPQAKHFMFKVTGRKQ